MFEGVRLVLGLEFLVSFCILMIFNHLLTYHENSKSETHYMKIGLFFYFEGVRLVLEPQFLVSFCIFPTRNNVPTDDKKFKHEAYDMKTGLFSWYFFSLYRL